MPTCIPVSPSNTITCVTAWCLDSRPLMCTDAWDASTISPSNATTIHQTHHCMWQAGFPRLKTLNTASYLCTLQLRVFDCLQTCTLVYGRATLWSMCVSEVCGRTSSLLAVPHSLQVAKQHMFSWLKTFKSNVSYWWRSFHIQTTLSASYA